MTLYRCKSCWTIYGRVVTEAAGFTPTECRVCGGKVEFFYAQDEDFDK